MLLYRFSCVHHFKCLNVCSIKYFNTCVVLYNGTNNPLTDIIFSSFLGVNKQRFEDTTNIENISLALLESLPLTERMAMYQAAATTKGQTSNVNVSECKRHVKVYIIAYI